MLQTGSVPESVPSCKRSVEERQTLPGQPTLLLPTILLPVEWICLREVSALLVDSLVSFS